MTKRYGCRSGNRANRVETKRWSAAGDIAMVVPDLEHALREERLAVAVCTAEHGSRSSSAGPAKRSQVVCDGAALSYDDGNGTLGMLVPIE